MAKLVFNKKQKELALAERRAKKQKTEKHLVMFKVLSVVLLISLIGVIYVKF